MNSNSQEAWKERCGILLVNIKARRSELEKLLSECSSHWGYEDSIYRFYHQSFKVFYLQNRTLGIVSELRKLLPGQDLNEWFLKIVSEGTATGFNEFSNQAWLEHTRPIVEAFFHARFMLQMAVRYMDLKEAPTTLPSGWAALLYLYNLR